ncbi:MAG: hypothetical protein J4N88_05805, partial [Chloroflexi bacterium]|nr:hypothetical protein [Chloroflexota bacterium]
MTLPDGRGGGITALMDVRVLDDVQLPPSIGLNILPRTVVVGPDQGVVFEAIALDFQSGQRLGDISMQWTMLDPSAGTVSQDGRFRASVTPGIYPDAVEVSIISPGPDRVSGETLTARATITILDSASSRSGVR